ncbi:MAG: cytochrome c oxidase subunit II [Phycisphaeraceae bacterium]|nr:cytochrome c oxidase subunit II [Phycisphaeraceae bacterium]
MTPTLAQLGQRFWMPDARSTYAGETDWLFYLIFWLSAGATVIIISLMIFFILRYRRRPGHVEQASPAHSTGLELTWSLIPLVAFMSIFYVGFRSFVNIATPPDYAYAITVSATKWSWEFIYPNGATSPELHVPKDRPIRLTLASTDVIHSLFVPAFRLKKDCVPNRFNTAWFQATEVGEYELYCAEYCGTKHSAMRSKVVVQEPGQFMAWLDNAAQGTTNMPPVEAGLKLFSAKGCTQCHSADGSANTGPTFKNLFGHEVMLTGGQKIVVDEEYIRESILNPSAKVVAGFENVMPPYQGRIKDLEITAMIEWLKSLSDKAPKPLDAFPAKTDPLPPGAGAQPGASPEGPNGPGARMTYPPAEPGAERSDVDDSPLADARGSLTRLLAEWGTSGGAE